MSLRLRRALAPALLLGLLPLGIASAQPVPLTPPTGRVQITKDKVDIRCIGRNREKCMTATKGTIFEVLYVDGDRYNHKNSNWYWVLLPPDYYGRRRTGWVKGNAVEHVAPPPPAPAAMKASAADTPAPAAAAEATPTTAAAEDVPALRPVVTEVVVNFEFNKSALTEEARRKLDAAFAGKQPTSNTQGLAVIALEGHTDAIGREGYNQRLGQARAESVKRYLVRLGIPADRMTVISYGESRPIAPNTTRAGRAENRRVMIQVGG
jgi:OOP family OmpA-OmpF porin